MEKTLINFDRLDLILVCIMKKYIAIILVTFVITVTLGIHRLHSSEVQNLYWLQPKYKRNQSNRDVNRFPNTAKINNQLPFAVENKRIYPKEGSCGNISCLFITDKYAYLGAGNTLYIFDISDPDNIVLTGQISISGCVSRICMSSNHVFIACCGFSEGE